MDFHNRLKREIRRAEEFDTTGLGIISYYLRLYIVEILLSRDERTAEETEIASDILDKIENFKNSINELPDDSREKETLLTLVTDDAKAKTYVTNFAMTLYNQQLVRIQKGPVDGDLIGALWCCIDLFNCILHLWSHHDIKTTEALEKRIKYCKVYISKIIKGELGLRQKEEQGKEYDIVETPTEGENDIVETPIEGENDIVENRIESENDITRENEQSSETDTVSVRSNEISHEMLTKTDRIEGAQVDISKLKLDDSQHDVRESAGKESISVDEPVSPHNEPVFIDSDNDSDVSPDEQTRYSTEQLNGMMDRSDRIEKAQKCAKYAISALNYEDIATARDELTKAMDLLNTLF